MKPTHHGPKKPPRLPIELIQAKPAASAVPLRNIGGTAKNGPLDRKKPIPAGDRPTRAHQGPMVRPASPSPPVDSTQAASRFHRRSFILSETRPQTTSEMPPQM